MSLDLLARSITGCRRWWLAAAFLVAAGAAAALRARAVALEAQSVEDALLERRSQIHRAALEESERRARSAARAAWTSRLAAGSFTTPVEAVQGIRSEVSGAGLSLESIESGTGTGLVDVHVRANGNYPQVRRLLADLESRPIGFRELRYDGRALALDIRVPVNGKAGTP